MNEEIILTNEEIISISKNIGNRINQDYQNKTPILIGILKGAIPFMAEVIKHINLPMQTEFMQISSYHGNTYSGEIRVLKDIDISIRDRDVIIVEDIVDTGKTLKKIIEMFETRGPKSIEVCSLLIKPLALKEDIKVKYSGKSIENEFVVGFGLDYQELYRNLPYIKILKL